MRERGRLEIKNSTPALMEVVRESVNDSDSATVDCTERAVRQQKRRITELEEQNTSLRAKLALMERRMADINSRSAAPSWRKR